MVKHYQDKHVSKKTLSEKPKMVREKSYEEAQDGKQNLIKKPKIVRKI